MPSAPGSVPRPAGSKRRLTSFHRVAFALLTLALLAALSLATRAGRYFGPIQAASSRAPQLGTLKTSSRAFHGHRLEPREAVVLLGGGSAEESSFASYAAALAPNRPMLTGTSVDLRDDLPSFFARLQRSLEQGEGDAGMLVPQIGLSMNAGDASRHYEDRVAAGKEDARLGQLVAGVRSLNRPVFLRLGSGVGGFEAGYQPKAFVAAFRRIHRALRAAGLEQAAMVWDWSPDAELEFEEHGARERDAAERWAAFYPGDDVVDWWSLSFFSEPGITGPVTARFLAEADQRGFPVMIGESTPRGHEVSEGNLVMDTWYRPYFSLIAGSRSIKAFCYIDRNWRAYPQWSAWGDSRVEADADVLRYVRAELSDPLYAGERDRASTKALLGVN